jgi:acylphosphatase
MALERRRVLYEGRVQGVGFRYTAQRLAPAFGVGGFVRNLPDGRVELEAQAEPAKVRAFLDAIRSALGSKIHAVFEEQLPADPDQSEGDFQILY